MDLKSIFQTKICMLDNDLENLKQIIQQIYPNTYIVSNYDRIIFIKDCSILNNHEKLNKAINKWINKEVSFPTYMLYDIFYLNNDSCLIKI